MIIGTTSQRSVLKQLDLQPIFNRELAVPNVNTFSELATILREVQAFDNEGDLQESLNQLKQYTESDSVGVGIKKVLLAVGEAKQERGSVPARFADIMEQLIASGRD